MAKRKTKKKAAPKKYLAMRSDCGSSGQLMVAGDAGLRATVDEAKQDVAYDIDCNGNDGGTYVIVEILDVGKPTGMTWGATLDD